MEEFVVLAVAFPLVVVRVPENPRLLLGVPLADDQIDPPARQHVDGGVVLGDPDRVEQRQHGDAGEQPDPLRRGREVPEDHGRRRCLRVVDVVFADAVPVESDLLEVGGFLDGVSEHLGRRGAAPRVGIR